MSDVVRVVLLSVAFPIVLALAECGLMWFILGGDL